MKKVLIGTTNESKVLFYSTVISNLNYIPISLTDIGKTTTPSENLTDLGKNSLIKAQKYSKLTGFPTVSDDTGIYIKAINNQPGVAVRRWGGKLKKDVSDQEWTTFFLNKVKDIPNKNRLCKKIQITTIALPNGQFQQIRSEFIGKIVVPDNLNLNYVKGSPFSAFFYVSEFNMIESDLVKSNHPKLVKQVENDFRKVFAELGI